MNKYEPYLRPASSFSLPKGITWEYVEAPWEGVRRPDLPRSLNRHGVISVNRRLTIEECEHFGLRVA